MYRHFAHDIPQLLVLTAVIALIPLRSAESQGGPCLIGIGNNCPTGGNTTPNPNTNSDPGGGTRYYTGPIAREILDAQKDGSRYMVILNRSWDASRNCYVEERAWVGGMRASGGGTVAVSVGPSRAVCVTNNTLTGPQVNQAEGHLATARNDLVKWLNYQQQLPAHFNGPHDTHARNEYTRATAWVNYYRQYITSVQASVAAVAP